MIKVNSFSLSFDDPIVSFTGSEYGYVELEYFFSGDTVQIRFESGKSWEKQRCNETCIKNIHYIDLDEIRSFVNDLNLIDDNEEQVLFDIVYFFMEKVQEFKEANKWNIY